MRMQKRQPEEITSHNVMYLDSKEDIYEESKFEVYRGENVEWSILNEIQGNNGHSNIT